MKDNKIIARQIVGIVQHETNRGNTTKALEIVEEILDNMETV